MAKDHVSANEKNDKAQQEVIKVIGVYKEQIFHSIF